VASVGSFKRLYSQRIKMLTNGRDSAEWAKTINGGLCRTIETHLPEDSTNRSVYNADGQLAQEVDGGAATVVRD